MTPRPQDDGAHDRSAAGSSDGEEPDPSRGLFVAGTGTGVGKTVVTAGLTGWHRETGADARAIKPAQTGHPPDDDASVVAAAAGGRVATAATTDADLEVSGQDGDSGASEPDDPVVAYRLRAYEEPLAPRVAAERADDPLEYDAVLADCRRAMEAAEVPVVEGIGGLRVPLAGDREVLDLAADLGLPALVVSRSGLGTLNHTALSVTALRRRGVPVVGVVLNEYEGAGVAERTNPDELRRMLTVPVWTLPPLDLSDPERAVDGVREAVPADRLGVRGG